MVVSDYFTRYTEAYALYNQGAKTGAHKLVNEFFLRFSLPEQLHSDQGRQFESDVIKEITNMLQIKKQYKSLSPSIRRTGRAFQLHPSVNVYYCTG